MRRWWKHAAGDAHPRRCRSLGPLPGDLDRQPLFDHRQQSAGDAQCRSAAGGRQHRFKCRGARRSPARTGCTSGPDGAEFDRRTRQAAIHVRLRAAHGSGHPDRRLLSEPADPHHGRGCDGVFARQEHDDLPGGRAAVRRVLRLREHGRRAQLFGPVGSPAVRRPATFSTASTSRRRRRSVPRCPRETGT